MTESAPTKLHNASDHLANERTFLAWVRTAIATMAFGIVLDRLQYTLARHTEIGKVPHVLPYMGTVFILIGLLTVVVALRRFAAVRKQLMEGHYEPDLRSLMILSAAVILLGLFLLAYLLIGP